MLKIPAQDAPPPWFLLESLDQGGVQGVSWNHDELNRLTQIASTVDSTVISSHQYEYNDANQRTRADLADGTYWEYSYDTLGQVTGGVKKDTSDNPIPGYGFGYTYDDIGNRKTSVENGRTTDYTRNLLNQYEGITRPAFAHLRGERGNTSTTIDVELLGGGLGPQEATYSNLLWYKEKAITDPVSTFEITATEGGNSNSETGSVYTPNGGIPPMGSDPQDPLPMHDEDGNLLYDHLWKYTWNAENRLVVQEHRDDVDISPLVRTKMEFTYDSQGRRVRKIVSRWDAQAEAYVVEQELRFIYDGWNLLAEIKTDDSLLRSHVWGLDLSGSLQGAGGVGGLLASRYHGTTPITALPFYDGNGNVMGYTDADTETVIATYEYDPFGRRIKTTGSAANLFLYRFSTKYECEDSGFLYYGFRYYDPETGRWPNRDPIEETGFQLLAREEILSRPRVRADGRLANSNNLYHFVFNSPVNAYDFLGLICIANVINPISRPVSCGARRRHWVPGPTSCTTFGVVPSIIPPGGGAPVSSFICGCEVCFEHRACRADYLIMTYDEYYCFNFGGTWIERRNIRYGPCRYGNVGTAQQRTRTTCGVGGRSTTHLTRWTNVIGGTTSFCP